MQSDNAVSKRMRVAKHVWGKDSIFTLLNEYRKLKDRFNVAKGSQNRKHLWEIIRKKLLQEGFVGIKIKHLVKKFCTLKRVYKEFKEGIPVGQRLYGFIDLLADILDDDPYISEPKPTKRILKSYGEKVSDKRKKKKIKYDSEGEDTEKFEGEFENLGAPISSLPPWVLYVVSRFKHEEQAKRNMMWTLHDEILTAERKKNDLLESLINCLTVEELPPTVHSSINSKHNLNSKVAKKSDESNPVYLYLPPSSKKRKPPDSLERPTKLIKHDKPVSTYTDRIIYNDSLREIEVNDPITQIEVSNSECAMEQSDVLKEEITTEVTIPSSEVQIMFLDENNKQYIMSSNEIYEVEDFYGGDPTDIITQVEINDDCQTSEVSKTINLIDLQQIDPSTNCIKIISAEDFKTMCKPK